MTAFQIPEQQALAEKEFEDRRRFCVIPFRASKDHRLSAAAWRVMTALAGYTNKAGLSWVSERRLGEDIGVSGVAVHYQLKKLIKAGYIERVAKGRNGIRASTHRMIFDESINTAQAIAVSGERPEHLQTKGEYRMRKKGKRQQGISENANYLKLKVSDSLPVGNELVDSTINQQSAIDALAAQYRAEGLPVPDAERLLAEIQGGR
jgi:DNA-binding Lrp family transcriptional regulator